MLVEQMQTTDLGHSPNFHGLATKQHLLILIGGGNVLAIQTMWWLHSESRFGDSNGQKIVVFGVPFFTTQDSHRPVLICFFSPFCQHQMG